MNKTAMKDEMLAAYAKELDVLLEEVNDTDDFATLEKKMVNHLDKAGQENYELMQKHKTFPPK